MAYKSILTIATDAGRCRAPPSLAAARRSPQRMDAHLDVLALGVDRTQVGYSYIGSGGGDPAGRHRPRRRRGPRRRQGARKAALAAQDIRPALRLETRRDAAGRADRSGRQRAPALPIWWCCRSPMARARGPKPKR